MLPTLFKAQRPARQLTMARSGVLIRNQSGSGARSGVVSQQPLTGGIHLFRTGSLRDVFLIAPDLLLLTGTCLL